jgi:hypothetical protein
MVNQRRTMRSPLWSVVAALVIVVFVLGGFAMLGGTATGTIGYGVAVAVALAAAVRALLLGVYVTADGLTVREIHRTHKLRWQELRYATLEHNRGQYSRNGPTLFNPTLYFERDGHVRLVTITSLGAYGRTVAEQRVDDINELIRQYTGRPTKPASDRPRPRRPFRR